MNETSRNRERDTERDTLRYIERDSDRYTLRYIETDTERDILPTWHQCSRSTTLSAPCVPHPRPTDNVLYIRATFIIYYYY